MSSHPQTTPTPPPNKRARLDQPSTSVPAEDNYSDTASIDKAKELRKQQLLQRLQKIANEKARLASSTSCVPSPSLSPLAELSKSPESEVQFVTERRTAALNSTSVPRRSTRCKSLPPAIEIPKPAVIDVDDISSPFTSVQKDACIEVVTPRLRRSSSRVPKPRIPLGDDSRRIADRPQPLPACMSKCKRLQFCKKLVSTMLKDRRAAPFSAPVCELWNPEVIPDYFNIITHPMDLGTIRKNLETRMFIKSVKTDVLPFRFDVDMFANDVRLVFRNAIIYNREGDALHTDAHCLLEDFEKTLKEQLPLLPRKEKPIPTSAASKKRKARPTSPPRKRKTPAPSRSRARAKTSAMPLVNVDCDTRMEVPRRARSKIAQQPPSSNKTFEAVLESMNHSEMKERLRYLTSCRIPVLSRAPVPKGEGYLSRAALLYDVPMPLSQQQKCYDAIGESRVPPEKLQALCDLISKSTNVDGTFANANLDSSSGDFEADMSQLDNKAWRNIEAFLEKFVPKFKTVRSSTLGREYSSLAEIDAEIVMIREKLVMLAEEKKEECLKSGGRCSESPKSFFEKNRDDDDSSSDSSSDSDSESGNSESSDDSGSESD